MKQFFCSCVGWQLEDVDAPGGLKDMIQSGKDITRQTFKRHVDLDELKDIEERLGYGPWLRMAKDWAVSYCKGKLHDQSVVWFTHSAIEYVFTDA